MWGLLVKWHLQEVRKVILALFLLKDGYISTCIGMSESPSSMAPFLTWICRAMVLVPADTEPDVPAITEVMSDSCYLNSCIILILSSLSLLIFWSCIRCGYVLLMRNRLPLLGDWQGIGLVTVISRTLWFSFPLDEYCINRLAAASCCHSHLMSWGNGFPSTFRFYRPVLMREAECIYHTDDWGCWM